MLTKQQALFIQQAAKMSLKNGEITRAQYNQILKKTSDDLNKNHSVIDRELMQKANSKFLKMQTV